MCGRTRMRVVREGARVRALIGEGDGKVGRNEKESGGWSEEGGGNEGRKGNQWKYEGGVEDEEREARIGKAFTLCKEGSVAIIKASISRRSARSVGKYRTKRGEIEVRG